MKIIGAKFQVVFLDESPCNQEAIYLTIKSLCVTEKLHCWRSLSESPETLVVNISHNENPNPADAVRHVESVFLKIKAIVKDWPQSTK